MTETTFDAKQETFGTTLFGNNGVTYEIPKYQRPYAWGFDQIDEFWTDLFESDSSDTAGVFLGSMVFTSNETKRNIVIDGQQRLITVTLFMAAIRDIYKNYQMSIAHVDRIQGNFISMNEFGLPSDNYRLVFEDSSRSILSIIQDKNFKYYQPNTRNKEEKNLFGNYKFFYDKILKNIEGKNDTEIDLYLTELFKVITRSNIVVINTKDVFSAYEVFETINSRGLDLTNTDLIKNWIFKDISTELELVNQWIEIERMIKVTLGFEFNKFIRYFFISKYGYVSNKNLFRRLKEKLGDNKEYKKEFLKNILAYSDYLIFINDPSFNNKVLDGLDDYNAKKICFSISGLNEMEITQAYPLIFSFLSKRNDISISKFLDLLVDFHLLYSKFTKSPAREVEKLYATVSQMISDSENQNDYGKAYNFLLSGLKSNIKNYVLEETFLRNFQLLRYGSKSNNSLIKYLLMRFYEDEIQLKYGYYDLTIEHIYSQSLKDRKNIHSIGNLTLLYGTGNGEIGNVLPIEKWDLYNRHSKNGNIKKLILDVENLSYSKDWTEEDINKRTQDLGKEIFNICYKRF